MIRPTLIDSDPIELNYYLFMISLSLYKCNGSCNVADDLSRTIYVACTTKDINVKVYNLITRINEAKTLVKYFSCDCECRSNSKTCNSNLKWNCQCKWKKYRTYKKNYSWTPSTGIYENSRYLKSIADNSVSVCN